MESIGALVDQIIRNPIPLSRGERAQQPPDLNKQGTQATQNSDEIKNDFKVSSRDASQYEGSTAPSPAKCEYCGAELFYGGILDFRTKRKVMMWFDTPERCSCVKAKEYWAAEDARAEAEKRAQQQREIDARLQAKVNRLFKESGIRGRFRNRTFEKFVIDEKNRTAYNVAKNYADTFHIRLPRKDERGNTLPPEIERNGLLMIGSYGTGKTHLSTAIANQLIGSGVPVIAMTMIDLLARIKQSYEYSETASEAEIMKIYEDIPLLIIDDIGSEQPTEWGITKIYAIINARYEAYMPTIVTTNYSVDELIARMTPAINGRSGDRRNAEKTIDRLKETSEYIGMFWESWRGK